MRDRYPRPKGRDSLIFAQNSLHLRHKCRGFFAQNKKGLSNILVILIIVAALAVVLIFAFRMVGGKSALPTKDASQTTSAGSELSRGDEVVDIEGDLDLTSFDDVDRDLVGALKDIETQ